MTKVISSTKGNGGLKTAGKPEATAEETPVGSEMKSDATQIRRILEPKVALDAGLTMSVKAYVSLKNIVIEADKIRRHARDIMIRMGIEIPEDGIDEKRKPTASKKIKSHNTPSSSTDGTLWELVRSHLFARNSFPPQFEDGSNIKDAAKQAGFSVTTTANLLSQKVKTGELIKGDRGKYAIPKTPKQK